MLRVVDNGLWAEVDDADEAGEELPAGTKFFHPEFGQCIALDLEEQRPGVRRFWYFALVNRMPKVYHGEDSALKFKIAAKHAEVKWPDPDEVDWRGDPI